MVITAALITLVVLALAARVLTFLARLLVTRRGPAFRSVVALAGLGYGLGDAARGTTPGFMLTVAGAYSAWCVVTDACRLLRARGIDGTLLPGEVVPAAAPTDADRRCPRRLPPGAHRARRFA